LTAPSPGSGAQAFTGTLNVLPGDGNGDGLVNSKDLAAVHRHPNVDSAPLPALDQDLNGDGKVNGTDYRGVKSRLGTKLPHPAAKNTRQSAIRDRSRLPSTKVSAVD
jgi:hypothetical protein